MADIFVKTFGTLCFGVDDEPGGTTLREAGLSGCWWGAQHGLLHGYSYEGLVGTTALIESVPVYVRPPTQSNVRYTEYVCMLLLLLFHKFGTLVANPEKLLYTVVNPARGLLNRKNHKRKDSAPPPTLLVRRK